MTLFIRNRILYTALLMTHLCYAHTSPPKLSIADIGNIVLQHDAARCIPKVAPISDSTSIESTDSKELQERFDAAKTWFTLLYQSSRDQIRSTMSQDAVQKLAILGGEEVGDSSLLSELHTQTIFGKAYAARQLVSIPSVEHTKKMQKITQDLIQKIDLNRLKAMLQQIHTHHTASMCLLKNDSVDKTSFFAAYGTGQAYHRLGQVNALANTALTKSYTIGPIAIPLYMTACQLPAIWRSMKDGDTKNLYLNYLRLVAIISQTSCLIPMERLQKELEQQQSEFLEKIVLSLQRVVQQLSHINQLTESIPTEEHPELAAIIAPIKELFHTPQSDLQRLFTMLKEQTFTGTATSIFGSQTNLLIATIAWQHRSKLIGALSAIGALDAHLAIAQLVTNTPHSPHLSNDQSQQGSPKFCFVDIVDQKKPLVHLRQSWNPLLTAHNPTKNDISLGTSQNAMMLTGPNGTGKTMTMKTAALNAVLAGAFGVAAAESATITPLTRIHTYFSPKDRIGKSTYMIETQTMDDIVTCVEQAPASEKILTIIDEPIKGTIERTGGRHVTEKTSKLLRDNNLTIVATHFEQPTTLAEKYPAKVTNYYLSTQQLTPTTFKRTYELQKGTCTWWFNNPEQRDMFTDWLNKQ